jgi:hypothetical protein
VSRIESDVRYRKTVVQMIVRMSQANRSESYRVMSSQMSVMGNGVTNGRIVKENESYS